MVKKKGKRVTDRRYCCHSWHTYPLKTLYVTTTDAFPEHGDIRCSAKGARYLRQQLIVANHTNIRTRVYVLRSERSR